MKEINYAYWTGRLSGFIDVMNKLYDMPEPYREASEVLLKEYNEAMK